MSARNKNLALASFWLLSIATPSLAQSAQKAQDARVMWSAFECSYFAFAAGKEEAGKRLFDFGFKRGQRFTEALLAGEIKKEDLQNSVPIGVSLLLNGPSVDFALGRIFEATQANAAEELSAANPEFTFDEELRIGSAKILFLKRNCEILR